MHARSTSQERAQIDGPQAWLRMAIAMLLGTVGSVGLWSVVVVLPAVQLEFGVDRAAASLPYTATMLGFALGNLLVGRFTDRYGVFRPLIVASLSLGAGFILASMSTAIWQFAILQGVLIGIGTSATFGPLIADISHWFQKRRGLAVAAVASGNYLAGAIWPTFLQAMISADGWRLAYFVAGVVCLVVMIPLALPMRRPPPDPLLSLRDDGMSPPAAGQGLLDAGMSPRTLQILLVAAGLACCMAMSMPQVHIVAYCGDLGYGAARGAEMLSLMLAGGVVSRLLSGYLADHIGGVRTILIGSVLQCSALFLYLPFDGLMSLYVVSAIFGLSQGGIVPSYAIIVREYLPAREAGERVGLVIMATVVGMALGGWMSGWIYDLTGSYQAAFINGIAWNVLHLSIILLILLRTGRRKPATA